MSDSDKVRDRPRLQVRRPTWRDIWLQARLLLLMLIGTNLAALGYVIFQVPHNIAAGGLSGVGIIVHHFTGWPVGLLYLTMNIPLLIIGYFHLGRWAFLLRTLIAATVFSVSADVLLIYLPQVMPQFPLAEDLLLNAVYAGIVGGIGGGLIYRAGGTMGGTGIIGRIIQNRTGRPLSQVYLYTDGLIIVTAGLVFGWEIALYAFLTLFLSGVASDYTLEGPSSTRTATIITNRPQRVVEALIARLHRGVSYWEVTGGYTGQKRYLVMCTVTRPQVNELKQVMAAVDEDAFITIGMSHQALGGGFGQPQQKRS